MRHLPLLLLAACGPSVPDMYRPLGALDPAEVADLCATDPWTGPVGCPPQIGATCPDVIARLRGCDISTCEYQDCASALAVSACGARPAECAPLVECLSDASGSGDPTTG